jgi:starvation-inducible DNA-binding protein
MKQIRETLPTAVRTAVAASLQECVVDFADLAMQAKQAHWALVGPDFKEMHEAMDALNALCLGMLDEVAERALALGILPLGQVKDVAKSATLPPLPEGFLIDTDVVSLMADRVAELVRRLRVHQGEVGDLDVVTEDILIEKIQALEKLLWMLQAREG